MGNLIALVLLGVPAFYVLSASLSLIGSPRRWPLKGRWIVWGRMPHQLRPSDSEIRFWAVVWSAIALAFLALGIVLLFADIWG